jgi:uncharacterized protein YndB with AHSA1/START domain
VNIDPVAVSGLLDREVRTGSRGGEPTRVVVARRIYGTDRADLWDALTNPERLPRWFLPVAGSLEPGGRYQFEGNAGGAVEACDEPSSFTVTWEMGPMVSWLTVNLSTVPSGTQLELVHEAPVDPAFWEQFGPGAVGVGWELAMMGLGLHLETRAPVDPEEGAGYALTPDGRRFVELSAAGWASAAIADGDDAEAARAAGDRTLAFYTTVPEQPSDG